ncbi:restriction endonuclease subunit R [Scytonema hofmannii PCC 7110]|uniref:Restriction endonuclease subunit R n=1 Tax=Scytonema hofmannii PCC 7110 TaxID=128403 RepID=A0A139WX70_9CYAN|nr:type I restriction endonuclease [Scytonema hofmannii]KYC37037.1 restriction endonuclease subunit R [Scytonema hofmannii PCC 7110]
MGFTEDITRVADRVRNNSGKAVSEEATKFALILPFLSALGYDVHEPAEVMPEYIADFAVKGTTKPKKVDFALAINGNIVMLIEAKACGEKPEAHDGQLRAYFNTLITARVGVVTNGIEYRFFTDLREPNIMDNEPFFSFNVLDYESKDVENLKLFHRDNFDATAISKQASEMVYVQGMTQLVSNLLRSPSDEFVHFLIGKLASVASKYEYKGVKNARVIQQFRPIVKKSIQESLLELMTRSLSQEMANTSPVFTKEIEPSIIENDDDPDTDPSKVVTTEEELSAFEKIKAIVKTSNKYKYEVQYKDTVSYFGLNLGKKTWWFLRLYLSSPTKKSFIVRLGVDEAKSLAPSFSVQEVPSTGEILSKVTISSIADLNNLTPLILKCYEIEAAKH